MTTTPQSELTITVAEARLPVLAPPMPRVGLALRLVTSPRLHRLLPRRVAVLLGQAHGLAVWLIRPQARAGARAAMDAILGATPRAYEAHALARRHVTEKYALRMLFWQPVGCLYAIGHGFWAAIVYSWMRPPSWSCLWIDVAGGVGTGGAGGWGSGGARPGARCG